MEISTRTPDSRPARRIADGFLASAVLVAIWKLGSLAVGIEMILPPPERVLGVFGGLIESPRFLAALGATALRGMAAFSLSMLLGSAFGFLMGSSSRFRSYMGPLLTVIRATPVLAIILLALIWFHSDTVPVFAAVVMAFPVVASDVAAGVRSADPRLIEMAVLFDVPPRRIALDIRLPSALPHVIAGARNAIGLSWKVVVAGEVLSLPKHALGTGMQTARVMLETAEVFAWAAAGILLCAFSDAIFEAFARKSTWPTA